MAALDEPAERVLVVEPENEDVRAFIAMAQGNVAASDTSPISSGSDS